MNDSSQSEKPDATPHQQICAIQSTTHRAQNSGRLLECATSSTFFPLPDGKVRSTYAFGTRQAHSPLSLAGKAALLLPVRASKNQELQNVHEKARFMPILPAHPVHERHLPPSVSRQGPSLSEKQGAVHFRQIGALRSSPKKIQNHSRLLKCATTSTFVPSLDGKLQSTNAVGTQQAGSSLSLEEKATFLLPTNANREFQKVHTRTQFIQMSPTHSFPVQGESLSYGQESFASVLIPATPYNLTGRCEMPIELRNLRRGHHNPNSMAKNEAENVTSTPHSDQSSQKISCAQIPPHLTSEEQSQQQSTQSKTSSTNNARTIPIRTKWVKSGKKDETHPAQCETADGTPVENVEQRGIDAKISRPVEVIHLTEQGQLVQIIETEECFELAGLHHAGYNYSVKNREGKTRRYGCIKSSCRGKLTVNNCDLSTIEIHENHTCDIENHQSLELRVFRELCVELAHGATDETTPLKVFEEIELQ